MDVGKYLSTATKKLADAGILTARLDALILLEDVLGINRALLLAHPERHISFDKLTLLNKYITQRQQHVPLAYIRGRVMFYGREFIVNNHVLVPRPETESLIDFFKTMPLSATPRIADVGTGSGCIGITVALESPGAKVFLYDIDENALAVARKNADALNVAVHAAKQDLLADCNQQFDVILANLPYVPDRYEINRAATFEPSLALFAGDDGLDDYRIFWKQLGEMPIQPIHVLIESLPEQQNILITLARDAGYARAEHDDYVQHFVLLDASEGENHR